MEKTTKTTKKAPVKKEAAKKTKTAETKKATTAKKPVAKKTATKKAAAKKSTTKPVEVKEEVKVETKAVTTKKENIVKSKLDDLKVSMPRIDTTSIEYKLKDVTKTTYALVAVIILLFILLIVSANGNKSTYKLANLDSYYENTSATVKVPKNWIATKSYGYIELFAKEDGEYTIKGEIISSEYDEDSYNTMIENYKANYEIEEITKKGYTVNHVSITQDSDTYDYYFIYKDNNMMYLSLQNATTAEANTILKGIKF